MKLPFGFSESPAEFQKRILNIFQALIQADKLLVYIDDLLIATADLDENLAILYEVLVLLRKYKLELNLSKCSFLESEIEYLGYKVNKNSIILSDRHMLEQS